MSHEKFSLPDHMEASIREALLKLKHCDGYTDRALSSMVPGASRATINKLTSDETFLHAPQALGIVYALASALWEEGNTRLVDVMKPQDVVFATRETAHLAADGRPDEALKGHNAWTDWYRAFKSQDAEAMAQVRERLRDLEKAAENEEALIRQNGSGATQVTLRGDGAAGEPATP